MVIVGRITIRSAELPRRPIARDRPKNGLEVVAMHHAEPKALASKGGGSRWKVGHSARSAR